MFVTERMYYKPYHVIVQWKLGIFCGMCTQAYVGKCKVLSTEPLFYGMLLAECKFGIY
jgi:hypothetical protein